MIKEGSRVRHIDEEIDEIKRLKDENAAWRTGGVSGVHGI